MSCCEKIQWGFAYMQNTKLVTAIGKLAVAGEQAGLSVEQMIQLLNDGLTVETLLELIAWRLTEVRSPMTAPCRSSRWMM
jgi:hypothetical protein